MNETEKPARASATASEYINDNFKHSDRIAVLVLNRNLGETTQRITTAQKAASPEFQAWLRYKNANGADIYVGMNPLKQDASTRTKDDIETIRHLYVDLDHDGSTALEGIKNSDLVPQPNYVLNTSPEKFQVVWKAEGVTLEEAEALQHAMVREFGGDPAATDSTRVLRLPGFANKKYDQDFYVKAYLSKASQPLRDIAQTILDTGLRPEEVFRIRVENIDFAARTIFNPFGKTKAARRTVTMTDTVWTALKRRAKTANGSYVFPSEKHPDRPIASVRKGHNAAIRRAVIKPHFVLYDLRHTFATRAVAAGVDLPTLSAMLGHTSITMTMRYVHPAAEQKRLAAAKLETFRVKGLMEAASEQAVGTKMGTITQVN